MGRLVRRFEITEDDRPRYGITHSVTVWNSIDGKTYYSCGIGRFCKSEEEAYKYIEDFVQNDEVAPGPYTPDIVLAYEK